MKKLVMIFWLLTLCFMFSACSKQDESKNIIFKGENEHWKMIYTISPNQKIKDFEGKVTTSNIESIQIKYKGNIKDISDVQKYRIGVQSNEMNTLFDKVVDQRFEGTGEIYVESYTSTSINKNEAITGWVLLQSNGEAAKREPIDLKSE